MLPALETILSGFGKHSAGRKPETPAVMKADLLAATLNRDRNMTERTNSRLH